LFPRIYVPIWLFLLLTFLTARRFGYAQLRLPGSPFTCTARSRYVYGCCWLRCFSHGFAVRLRLPPFAFLRLLRCLRFAVCVRYVAAAHFTINFRVYLGFAFARLRFHCSGLPVWLRSFPFVSRFAFTRPYLLGLPHLFCFTYVCVRCVYVCAFRLVLVTVRCYYVTFSLHTLVWLVYDFITGCSLSLFTRVWLFTFRFCSPRYARLFGHAYICVTFAFVVILHSTFVTLLRLFTHYVLLFAFLVCCLIPVPWFYVLRCCSHATSRSHVTLLPSFSTRTRVSRAFAFRLPHTPLFTTLHVCRVAAHILPLVIRCSFARCVCRSVYTVWLRSRVWFVSRFGSFAVFVHAFALRCVFARLRFAPFSFTFATVSFAFCVYGFCVCRYFTGLFIDLLFCLPRYAHAVCFVYLPTRLFAVYVSRLR